jgi:hypothetical protein
LCEEKKYEFMAVAIDMLNTTPAVIVHSWEICGISKALFQVGPAEKYRSHYDRLLDEQGHKNYFVDVDAVDEVADAEVDDEVLQQLEQRGAQGAPTPMAPPKYVENEVVVKDPRIVVDHIFPPRARGRPTKRPPETAELNDAAKVRHKAELTRLRRARVWQATRSLANID